jgi:hypothetical protein
MKRTKKTLISNDEEWFSLKPYTIVYDGYLFWQLKNLNDGLPRAWRAINMTHGDGQHFFLRLNM